MLQPEIDLPNPSPANQNVLQAEERSFGLHRNSICPYSFPTRASSILGGFSGPFLDATRRFPKKNAGGAFGLPGFVTFLRYRLAQNGPPILAPRLKPRCTQELAAQRRVANGLVWRASACSGGLVTT